MTEQRLDEVTEAKMYACEGIQYTNRSPAWNALRDRIRQLQAEAVDDYQRRLARKIASVTTAAAIPEQEK